MKELTGHKAVTVQLKALMNRRQNEYITIFYDEFTSLKTA